ncbi:type II secretion system protein GspD [Colibacter massiliensis]|uniref:type II secretion system protein GspD n=1 Tax=Colibacter massiliensis TaxID=1852379 RepID=UPI0023532EFC|nr:secretin N-terminal domain-containing protein [Colibacter massiliensis]
MNIRIFTAAALLAVYGGTACAAGNLQIDVHEVPTRTVLEGLARSNNMNLVVNETVTGNLTMHLHDVSAEEALQAVVDNQNLFVEEHGGIRVISGAVKDDGAQTSYSCVLAYAGPDEIGAALTSRLSAEKVKVYSEGNAVVVSGTRRDVEAAKRLIGELDKPAGQVDVEVEILSLNKEAVKELGIDWSWSGIEGGVGRTHLPYAEAQIHAFLSTGKADVLARPHIVAKNGQEARIFIGDKIPVVTEHVSGGERTSTTEYKDAGILLQYTPRIHRDGTVTAKIHGEVSMPVYVRDLKAYSIATRQVDTEVRVKANESLVIGGLIGKEEVENFRKIPILGDIPILGKLFQSRYRSRKETEVVIIIKSAVLPSPFMTGADM